MTEDPDRYGKLESADGRWRLRFTRTLAHPPEKVWAALTKPEHLAAWFPTTIEGETAPGAVLRFEFPYEDSPTITGEMITYQPPTALEFRWDRDILRFDLRPEGDGTFLTLLSTFDEVGVAARDAAGWHACLDLLVAHLDGQTPDWDAMDRHQTVHPHYVKEFGPAAASIGPPDWAT